jgi:putative PIN family toxin of toxin-antitoxin system
VRVFLDTNVLVSAFTTRGLCADVLRTAMMDHQLLTGEVVLAELERILSTKFRVAPDLLAGAISLLRGYPVQPLPPGPAAVYVRDADDAMVLASALAASADVLVTGDNDLLVVSDVGTLRIISPRAFWEIRKPRPA